MLPLKSITGHYDDSMQIVKLNASDDILLVVVLCLCSVGLLLGFNISSFCVFVW